MLVDVNKQPVSIIKGPYVEKNKFCKFLQSVKYPRAQNTKRWGYHTSKKKRNPENDPHDDKLSFLTQPKRRSQHRTGLLNKIQEVHEFTREGRCSNGVQLFEHISAWLR